MLNQRPSTAHLQQQQQQQKQQRLLCLQARPRLAKPVLHHALHHHSLTWQQQHQYRASPICASAAAPPAAAAHAAAPTAADPCLALTGIQDKAVGALLVAMCGNALGAQVEPEKHYRLAGMFPNGLQDMSWTFDISPTPLPAGHVTGDYAIMAAVGQSVVCCQSADPLAMAEAMAASYDASAPEQWYSPYSRLMLEGLAAGSNPFLLARQAEAYLATTASRASNTASHRPERQLHGMTDFSALARVIPVAVAYRQAPLPVLRQAAEAAVMLTHPSDTAADAAAVLAAAVAWCLRADPDSAAPEQLLDHLLGDVAATEQMKSKLTLLQDSLPALAGLGSIDSWPQFWRSKAWSDITSVANLLSKQNLAAEATQAAALALWVVLVSWRHPKQAVMLAASLGGYAATTGTLAGSMTGALHGCGWVPQAWWDALQDEPQAAGEEEAHGGPAGQEGQHSDGQTETGAEQAQQQQQQGLQEEQQGQQAAVGEAAGEERDEDGRWDLRPVSKYSMVILGHQLAELRLTEVAGLL